MVSKRERRNGQICQNLIQPRFFLEVWRRGGGRSSLMNSQWINLTAGDGSYLWGLIVCPVDRGLIRCNSRWFYCELVLGRDFQDLVLKLEFIEMLTTEENLWPIDMGCKISIGFKRDKICSVTSVIWGQCHGLCCWICYTSVSLSYLRSSWFPKHSNWEA